MQLRRWIPALFWLFAAPAWAVDPATPIAITIDDLPWVKSTRPGESPVAATERLLAGLTERSVPAVGFVNCDNTAEGAPVIEAWLAAGFELGNHSASHMNLHDNKVGVWLADVGRCDDWLTTRIGKPVTWFRYPYLRQGRTPDKRDAAYTGLAEMGYRIAHVTADNSEWRLAFAYARALDDGDAALQAQIAKDYVTHMVASAEHARQVARDKLGRDGAHVLLLHANALAADHLDDALDAMAAAGFRFATLEEVHADPLYARVDSYAGDWGMSWLYRFAPDRDADKDWDRESDQQMRALYGPKKSKSL